MKFSGAFNKVEDLVDTIREYDIKDLKELKNLSAILKKNKEIEEKKKNNTWVWILAIIGAIVVCAGIGYAIYRFLVPDYLEDFDDDFEDFDDDFFEDEDDDDLTDWDKVEEVEVNAKEDVKEEAKED
ncbi:MAG: hypothetical protein MJZ11_11265 [Lachnospiraceae bacterium]|nr:hypothetical protein [Lachnospiraceae bacterium]